MQKIGIIRLQLNLKKVKSVTDSTIARELLKQIEQLPLESRKKVLEFTRALNVKHLTQNEADFCWDQFYGIAKGLWQEDAQAFTPVVFPIRTI